MNRTGLWIEFLLCIIFGVISLKFATSIHERSQFPVSGYLSLENPRRVGVTARECPKMPDTSSKPVVTSTDVTLPTVPTPQMVTVQTPLPDLVLPEYNQLTHQPQASQKEAGGGDESGQIPQITCPYGTVYYRKVIWFDSNGAVLDDQSPMARKLVDELRDTLKHHPDGVVEIVGHSDKTGSPDKNQALSMDRAERVSRFVKKETGITTDRIRIVAFGSTKPWDEGTNYSANARNRRVELRILENEP